MDAISRCDNGTINSGGRDAGYYGRETGGVNLLGGHRTRGAARAPSPLLAPAPGLELAVGLEHLGARPAEHHDAGAALGQPAHPVRHHTTPGPAGVQEALGRAAEPGEGSRTELEGARYERRALRPPRLALGRVQPLQDLERVGGAVASGMDLGQDGPGLAARRVGVLDEV